MKVYEQKDFLPEGLHRAPTILVVDDDPHVRKLLQFYLKRSGCDVLTAGDGPQALGWLERAPVVDVVLLDLRLPGMDGIETLRRINEQRKASCVIVMTAYGTMEEAIQALKLGAYDFVKKTHGLDDLRLAIRNALHTVGLKEEVQHLKARLEEREHLYPEIVSQSEAMNQVKKLVHKITNRDITVLIEGESGSGKELIARAIHRHSDQREKPFVAINCAAIPETLLESELFGHERGAFTGATARRVGKFEEAHGGILFLDEISEMALPLQAKLLRVLQTKEIEPVGGQARKVNVRILSATNRRLGDAVRRGAFRQDLYFRLAVFPILIPPLRERREDIPLLARFFLERFVAQEGSPVRGITPEVEAALTAYDWPGNVRELENMMYRAVVLAEGDLLRLRDFPVFSLETPGLGAPSPATAWAAGPAMAWPPLPPVPEPADEGSGPPGRGEVIPLEQAEALAIRRALRTTGGNISRAAELLRISRATLYRKSRKFQIALR